MKKHQRRRSSTSRELVNLRVQRLSLQPGEVHPNNAPLRPKNEKEREKCKRKTERKTLEKFLECYNRATKRINYQLEVARIRRFSGKKKRRVFED